MQQQQARLRSDRDPDFIGDLQPVTAFETFLVEKNLDVIEKLCLIVRRKPDKEGDVVLDDFEPLIRKRPRLQPFTMSIFKKAEH